MFTKRALLASALVLMTSTAACRSSRPLSPEPPSGMEGWVDDLAEKKAPGSVREGKLYRGATRTSGGKERFGAKLEVGKCYFLAAVGDQNVDAISLYLWDPSGSRVESEREATPETVLKHCPESSGIFEFELKTARGNGHFAAAFYSMEAPEAPPPEVEPTEPTVDLEALVEKEAEASAPGAVRVGSFFKDKVDKRDWNVRLEKGKCYWLIGAGEPGEISEMTLYLWDPNDDRITQSKSQSNMVSVGHCPKETGMHRFQAAIGSGSGHYAVGLYEKGGDKDTKSSLQGSSGIR